MKRVASRIIACGVIFFATCAFVVCASISQARADLERRLGELGPALDELSGEPGEHGDVQVLSLNGSRIEIRSETVGVDVGAALDAAQQRCGGDAGSMLATTMASWDAESGFVGCFPALRRLDPESLVAAAELLLAGGDARGLGPFVYTYAHRTARGTHLVVATLPELDLGEMFPARGDAPGGDLEGVPRPHGARRILTVSVPDRPYRVVVYSIEGVDPAVLAATYEEQLEAANWELRRVISKDGRRVSYAFLDGSLAAIIVRPDRGGATVTVAYEL